MPEDGGGTGQCSTAGSRSRSALRKAARSLSVAAVLSIKAIWNFTDASDSSHASRRNKPTKDGRSSSSIARVTCCLTKASQGLNGSGSVDVGLVFNEVLDKFGPSRPAIDPPAQLGVD